MYRELGLKHGSSTVSELGHRSIQCVTSLFVADKAPGSCVCRRGGRPWARMAAVLEVENRLPGRVNAFSAFQAVESHLLDQQGPADVRWGMGPGVRVLGLGTSAPGLFLSQTALVQLGMPLSQYSSADGIAATGSVTIACPKDTQPPYSEFRISGDTSTVHGLSGDASKLWLDALMEVRLEV
jgi:hypothetical protein